MRWRWIRCAIVLLLLIANIGIFALVRLQEQGTGRITGAEWTAARELYAAKGITWELAEEDEIPYYPAKILTLASTDLRSTARTAMGEGVTATYLYDSITRFAKDGNIVLVSAEKSSLDYYRNSQTEDLTGLLIGEEIAGTFGDQFVATYSPFDIEMDVYISRIEGMQRILTYYQCWEGELLLFNSFEVTLDCAGVRRGNLNYYSIESVTAETELEYPLDELLYQCLRQVEADGQTVESLTQLEYAYRLEEEGDSIQGIPCLYLVFDDSVTYILDRIIR